MIKVKVWNLQNIKYVNPYKHVQDACALFFVWCCLSRNSVFRKKYIFSRSKYILT